MLLGPRQWGKPRSSRGATEPARAHESTTRRYLDVFTDALMVRPWQRWYPNLGKRQVKSPRVYGRDSGRLHQRLGVDTEKQLLSHLR